jgi:hypothetical protein
MTENHKSGIEQVRIKVENNCEIQKERQEKKATVCARYNRNHEKKKGLRRQKSA